MILKFALSCSIWTAISIGCIECFAICPTLCNTPREHPAIWCDKMSSALLRISFSNHNIYASKAASTWSTMSQASLYYALSMKICWNAPYSTSFPMQSNFLKMVLLFEHRCFTRTSEYISAYKIKAAAFLRPFWAMFSNGIKDSLVWKMPVPV